MKKIAYLILSVMALTMTVACDNYETYGDKKKKERNAISEFLADSAINVIQESAFNERGQVTDVSKNEYVYLPKSGVYMQIVREGCGTLLEEDKRVNLLLRYTEYNILDGYDQTSNLYQREPDKMTVSRTGSTYTASFTSGVMYSSYGASVPSGWLVPLQYVKLGRQSDGTNGTARVRLIVPHTQGHSYASSSVYPCFYEITYQREK